jgi:hypothetical protein
LSNVQTKLAAVAVTANSRTTEPMNRLVRVLIVANELNIPRIETVFGVIRRTIRNLFLANSITKNIDR